MNKVVHFEVPYDDKDRSMKFYQDVFDWELQDMPEMKYTMARTVAVDDEFMPTEAGAINGGMYKREEGIAASPVLVIEVPDIEAHIEKVKAHGGAHVMGKAEIPDMGYYAQVKDTEGNIIGLWEAIKK